MSAGATIVIPALGDVELLESALRSLQRALEPRHGVDEILVVDDTGHDLLGPWLMEHFPLVRCLANPRNLGFARALTAGVLAAKHERVFAMNSDVRVRAGFLEPLEEALENESVFAAVPRILLHGREGAIESLVIVRLESGIARAVQPALEQGRVPLAPDAHVRVPFPIGGACLFRREALRALGGFDAAFEPFYLEDMDLGWRAWKAGLECWYVGSSVVEHHHRGTIGALVPEALVLTAIERNRLLFTWKHLDEPALLREHLEELSARIDEARVDEQREFFVALCIALEDRLESGARRDPAAASTWTAVLRHSDPFRAD